MHASVDDAIRSFCYWDPDGEDRLAASGFAGLHRVLELWKEERLPRRPDVFGRTTLERSWEALRVVAEANPEAFVDAMIGQPIDGTVVSILGGIDDPRASRLLSSQLSSSSARDRCTAVNSLGRRADAEAHRALAAAVEDDDPLVRLAAIEGLSRWEPTTAAAHYEEFLAIEGLTPMMRAHAEAALADLRREQPVANPFHPRSPVPPAPFSLPPE